MSIWNEEKSVLFKGGTRNNEMHNIEVSTSLNKLTGDREYEWPTSILVPDVKIRDYDASLDRKLEYDDVNSSSQYYILSPDDETGKIIYTLRGSS